MKPIVAAIVGPTAVGKSGLAIEVAERLDAEIVSVDSMQVYRGMDIGTDKATSEMRARVPHHLIDIREPSEDVSVAEFQRFARDAIEDITARGRLPLLVGGSGLYFRAVVDDLRIPPTEPLLRARLEDEAEALGAGALHERLRAADPTAAARIEPSNARRTIRALEVIELTGRPFSENDSWDGYESIYELRAVGLERPRSELDVRIAGRVASMMDKGLVDEARALSKRGLSRTARMALGYRQILDHPESTATELQELIARATKRFARRQESWFRSDPRVKWLRADLVEVVERAVAALSLTARSN